MNGTVGIGKKSSPTYDEELTKCLNRNTDKEKKSKIEKNDISSREHSASPSFKRSLTPSLDPKLLRQFEEEDRPKRVLRSSTVAASIPKITVTNGTVINHNSTKVTNNDFIIKMAATKSANRKSVLKKSRRKKSEKLSTNFTADKRFLVGSISCPTKLNKGTKRKRIQSKDDSKATKLNSKRLKVSFRLPLYMHVDSIYVFHFLYI